MYPILTRKYYQSEREEINNMTHKTHNLPTGSIQINN